MDSLTQIALGAAMGELVMGRKIAGKAALYAAAIATLPDLDVLVPMGSPVADFTYHRSWSHSLIVLTAVSPLIALAIHRWRRDPPEWLRSWMLLVFLALFTHPLLDAFTIYGTQLLWPITEHPFGIGSIFIIDPLYTLPLAASVVVALFSERTSRRRRVSILAGIIASSAYLLWTVVGQGIERRVATRSLDAAGLSYARLITIPAPFNSVLWRSIAIAPDGESYHIGYHSLLDGTDVAQFQTFPAGHALLEPLAGHWPVERLKWFTKGFFNVSMDDTSIVMSDLRMGVEQRYVFGFVVAVQDGLAVQPIRDTRVPPVRDLNGLSRIWSRIWDAGIEVVPRR